MVLASEKGLLNTGCTATSISCCANIPTDAWIFLRPGRRRFEILRLNEDRSFLRGAIEFFDDEEAAPPPPETRQQAIAAYNELQKLSSQAPLAAGEANDAQLSFRLARPVNDLATRQILLAMRTRGRAHPAARVLPAGLPDPRAARAARQASGAAQRPRPRAFGNRMNLLIDADDTLWENNIYFERAFDAFCDFLDHSTLKPPEIREVLNEIELVNAKIHGYGAR